ncbi:MAG: FecR family protein [Burkholderiaceae bacterium]
MNHHHLKHSAIKSLFALTLLSGCATAFATQVVGTVTDLSGFLLVRTTTGTVKILAQQSRVESGDTLVSEQGTYARIKFLDNSEITLRPNSQLTIEKFSYDAARQENDNASFRLIKGGLRFSSGLIGKRSQDRYALHTETSTINIREATFIADYVPDEAPKLASYRAASMAVLNLTDFSVNATRSDVPLVVMPLRMLPPLQLTQITPSAPKPGGLAPGLYVSVIDGAINLTNKGGSTNFSAGQFGYTANVTKPPVVVPTNPGLQFTPPPTFSMSSNSKTSSSSAAKAVDCEVR